METWLKRICVICIILVIIIGIYDIYNDYVLPKRYNKDSRGIKVTDEAEYNLCNNAILKYYVSINNDINNIRYFMPNSNRSNEKTNLLDDNLKNYTSMQTYNIYKLANNIYKIDYSIFSSNGKEFSMVIKINKFRNYYIVIYDELYENGKVG